MVSLEWSATNSGFTCYAILLRYKDWPAKKVTIFDTIVHLVKLQRTFWFLACILHDYVADDITK